MKSHAGSGNFFAVAFIACLILVQLSQARATVTVAEGPPLPKAVAGHAGGIVDGLPVVVGGSGWTADKRSKEWSSDCFVLRGGRWVPGPSLPVELSDMAYASDASGLYLVGGTDGHTPSRATYRLSSTDEHARWQSLASLPVATEACTAAIVRQTLYLVGGYANGKATSDVWSIDLAHADAKWIPHAPLPAASRGYAAMAACDGSIYLFGGFNSPPYQKAITIFEDAFRYDPVADAWSPLPGFKLAGYGWTATCVDPLHILLTGRVPALSATSSDIWLANVSTGHTLRIGDLIMKACCMPVIPIADRTWCIPGGEPAAARIRTDRTSVVTLDGAIERD